MNSAADAPIQYQPGDRVRVVVGHPGGHFRTPAYIQGQTGRIAALGGVFANPESLAYGGTGQPRQPLYRVEFIQSQVWPDYLGPAADTILVDIYQHWLEPASGEDNG